MDIDRSIAYSIMFICFIISFIHYIIVQYIYLNKIFRYSLAVIGIAIGVIICIIANICFRFPMLLIYIFDEKKNEFAALLTIVLSIISCFALSFSTYFFVSHCEKILESNYFDDDYQSLMLSLGFYPSYIIFYFLIDLLYFYNIYGVKYFIFSNITEKVTQTAFHKFIVTINIFAIIVCLYNGIILSWFYMRKREKKTLIECILIPSLINTIPFFFFFLYKINFNLFIILIMCFISISASISIRITKFKKFYKQPLVINLSQEEEDDLVEFIDDRICLENLNKELNFNIPNSFSGIIFENKL